MASSRGNIASLADTGDVIFRPGSKEGSRVQPDGVLVSPAEAVPGNADLAPLAVRLLVEVDQLRAKMAGLRRDNLEFFACEVRSIREELPLLIAAPANPAA